MRRIHLPIALFAIAMVAVLAAQQPPPPRDPQRELMMNVADGFTVAAVGDNIIARPVSQTPGFAPVPSIVPAVLASVTSTANAARDNCGGTGNGTVEPAPRAARGLQQKQTRDRPPTRIGRGHSLLRPIRRRAESVEYFSFDVTDRRSGHPLSLGTTSSRAVSPSCPSVVHRHSMGAPTPAAPHSHSGLGFRNRLEGEVLGGAFAPFTGASGRGASYPPPPPVPTFFVARSASRCCASLERC